MKSARRTSVGPTATDGFTRIWSAWRTWARTGTRRCKDCVNQYSDKRTKLWSFEVKLLINRSNVRECFFQSVSNSSWSNFGYLVAAEIEGQDTLKELRMLFAAHGIGLIKLDADNPC